jgi:hypothetical protein
VGKSSIAIWYSPKDKSQKPQMDIEANFNLWKLTNSKTHKPSQFIDIGLMIPQPNVASRLNIYMPIKSVKDIEDLGSHLENTTTIQAIFNEKRRKLSKYFFTDYLKFFVNFYPF